MTRFRNSVRTIVLITFGLLVFGPPASHAGIPDASVFRVVVLGSSTAAGEAAMPLDSSWVNKYKNHLGTIFQSYEVVNLAVGGFTTFKVMPNGYQRPSPWDTVSSLAVDPNRNITKALSLNPSLILINLPTNDCAIWIPVAQQLSNFDALIGAAQSQGVPVYLSTTQPRGSVQSVRTLLIQMRDAINIRYPGKVLDFWTGLANPDGTIAPAYNADGTHFNNGGHAVLFERVRSTVQLNVPVAAAPTPLGFGNRKVGIPAVLPVTITNFSASTILFNTISTGTARFTSNRGSASVPPGGTADVLVTFTAPGLGTFRDTLFLYNNSSIQLMKVPLSGVAPAPVLQAVPGTLSFGDVATSSGRQLSLTLQNDDLNAGVVSSITSNSGLFVATPASGTINPSESWNVNVTFTPTAFGVVTDTLRINGSVYGGTFKIPVNGRSPVPVLAVTPTELDFGDVPLTIPRTLQISLGNTTVNTLTLDAAANSKSEFFVDPSSGFVPANGSLLVSVTFAPSAFGTVTDTIQIISNATVSPLRIPIRGRSPVPSVSLSHTSVAFPVVGQGDGTTRTVYLRNTGVNPLTLQSFVARTTHFAGLTPTPVVVPGSDSLALVIRFAPQASGDLRDTLTIVTDGGDAQVAVTGSSPVSYLRVSPAPMDFGSGKVGTTVWQSCVLKVQSPDPLFSIAVDSVRLRGAGFVVNDPGGRRMLGWGDSLQLLVGFAPTQHRVFADTLLVYNNSALTVTRVPISGRGDTFTEIVPETQGIPGALVLHQNYPNPFNPTTEISYALAGPGRLVLQVFDLLGQDVATLVDEWQEAGVYRVRFAAAGLPSGMYVYRLRAGESVIVRRMLLLR